MNKLNNRSRYTIKHRLIAFMLTIVMAMSMGITDAFAGTAVAADDNTNESSRVISSSIPGLSFTLTWADSEFKNGTAFDLVEYNPVSNQARMQVSYSCTEIREEGYAVGEIIITVKGIGAVNRDGVIQALVGADKASSTTKTRDWSYTWNSATDTYTFTNNAEIKPNSVFSGYFELVWEIDARKSIHGYEQSGISATIYMPDGTSQQSEVLSFTNTTRDDDFQVYIETHEMYSHEGLTDGIDNPDDYVFIRYDLSAFQVTNTRGLESSYYIFDPDLYNTGSGAIVISPNMTATAVGDGTYKVGMTLNTDTDSMLGYAPVENYIFVAYPKSEYRDENVTADIKMYGAYYEGSDEGVMGTHLLSEASVQIPIPADFTFSDIPGDVYEFWKDTWYDKFVSAAVTQEQGGDIVGSKMFKDTVETFYLEGILKTATGENYTMEIVDDFMYVMKNNGTYRALAAHEYAFTTVTIPSASAFKNLNGVAITANKYNVHIYAAQNGALLDLTNADLTPVWSGQISGTQQVATLPENTTAIAIVVQDMTESLAYFYFPVTVTYHLDDTTGLDWGEQDNLTSGQVVNVSFIRLWQKDDAGEYVWMNDYFNETNYDDQTNLHTPDKDIALYGSHLDRERDNITFYEGDRSDYASYASIGSINIDGPNDWSTTVTIGANFGFAEDEHPNQFSLYTILPDYMSLSDYKIPEDIWDNMTLSGMGLTEEELAAACTPEIIENYGGTGRTYIALHFEFDEDMLQSSSIRAEFNVDMSSYRNAYVRSSVIMDEDVYAKTLSKKSDNGTWGDDEDLFFDIDRDGDSEELLASGFAYRDISTYADSSQVQITKYVQTTYSDGWVQLPDVPYEEFSGEYQYKLLLTNGNSIARNITMTDIIETGENMEWQGKLQSVSIETGDGNAVDAIIKYGDGNDNWSTDYATYGENTRVVELDFGDFELDAKQELAVIITMKAPSMDDDLAGKITENGYSVSMTMYDMNTGNETKYDDLSSNFVQVQLTYLLTNIIITKRDAENQQGLSGATFELVHSTTGEVVATATSNARGYVIFKNAVAGQTYIIREVTAPYGYVAAEPIEVQVGEDDIYLTIDNERETGIIEVYKVNDLDDDIPVSGATYALMNADGNEIATAVTDEYGVATFVDIPWGKYTVKETVSPVGYQLNETVYAVEITRKNVSDIAIVDTCDEQDPVYVHLVKYVMTADGKTTTLPMANVSFELVRKATDGDKRIGIYVTDADGQIDVTDLPYGEYYFREYQVPNGYISADDVSFTLTPAEKDVTVIVYNQQRPGKVIVTKTNSIGDLVEGIEFTLYASDKTTVVATGVTNAYGLVEFDALPWGVYYIKETKTPDCYMADAELKEVSINADALTVYLSVVNETVKGSVVLTKVDAENEDIVLSGAEYTLYDKYGHVVGVYVTDANGKIEVAGLEWGSYYFKETKSPDGYSISSETVRFSVNADNAGVAQEIAVEDVKDARFVSLIKRIKVSDINWENGNPTFVFKVTGIDINGKEHIYHQMIVFDKAYVEQYAVDGYVSQTIVIGDMTAGEYVAAEVDVSRYTLEDIGGVVGGEVIDDIVVFDLVNNKEGSAIFTNYKYEHQDYSDNSSVTNIMKDKTKLTALKVSYGDDVVDGGSAVNHDILTVIAIYDDGSTSVLSSSQYSLDIGATFPNVNGEYTVVVSYTESGVTKSGTFVVTIEGAVARIVSLEASIVGSSALLVGSEITNDMFEVIGVYNTGERRVLAENEYTVSPVSAPSVDGSFTVDIDLDLTVTPNDGYAVGTTVDMMATTTIPVLETGKEFAAHIPDTATSVVFTDKAASASAIDVSAAKDGSVMAWLDGTTFYVSSQRSGVPVQANADSSYMFQNKSNLTTIKFGDDFDCSTAVNMSYMFYYCKSLTSVDVESLCTSSATNMNGVFWHCDVLESITFGPGWTTENVTLMSEFVRYCYKLTSLDLSRFETKNVQYMNGFFSDCLVLESITFGDGWDVGEVINMSHMFYRCKALKSLDLSRFSKSSKVLYMDYMFSDCIALTELDVTPLDTSSVIIIDHMFYNMTSVKRLDCSGFDTSHLSNFSYMFGNCTALEEVNVSGFTTAGATNLSYMFRACQSLKSLDLSSFDLSMNPTVTYMFFYCNAVETAYARTSDDAAKLNADATQKPTNWEFVVK